MTALADAVRAPRLPSARGPISAAVLDLLRGRATRIPALDGDPHGVDPHGVDPYSGDPNGEDIQLALYCCYELHYRGFAGVSEDREWDPAVLAARGALERVFLAGLRRDVHPAGADRAAVTEEVDRLLVEPVGPGSETSVSHHLRRRGELWQLREYVAHRSLYHLKEADPQTWVIPRLTGPAKAALVSVQHDEYGGGQPERMHAAMFAAMMAELDLDPSYGAYLDLAPAPTLAEVNLMSLCGLHRSLRAALVGQFAVVELTSSPGSLRLVQGMHRLGLAPAATAFYDEHVEADAVHEQLIRTGVLAPLLDDDPGLAADVVFGMRAALWLGERSARQMLDAWHDGRTSLNAALPGSPSSVGRGQLASR